MTTETLPGMEETINDELAKAIEELRDAKESVDGEKERLELAKEKVYIEMKKQKKDYLRIQLKGEFYQLEIARADEKVKFGKARM